MLQRSFLLVSLLGSFHPAFAGDIVDKISCKEAERVEAKCKEYDAATLACDAAADAAGKAQIAAAKTEQDECKKKNGVAFALRCSKEIKKVTTLVNTPAALLKSNTSKELASHPESPCAKAQEIGTAEKVCQAPKKVFETLKANCLKV